MQQHLLYIDGPRQGEWEPASPWSVGGLVCFTLPQRSQSGAWSKTVIPAESVAYAQYRYIAHDVVGGSSYLALDEPSRQRWAEAQGLPPPRPRKPGRIKVHIALSSLQLKPSRDKALFHHQESQAKMELVRLLMEDVTLDSQYLFEFKKSQPTVDEDLGVRKIAYYCIIEDVSLSD